MAPGTRQPANGARTADLSIALPADARAPSLARREVGRLAGLDVPTRDDLLLLVSELVTNSVRHAGLSPTDAIELSVRIRPTGVRAEIRDSGPGFDPHRPRSEKDGGYGLHLLRTLADRWGIAPLGEGRVWFELNG